MKATKKFALVLLAVLLIFLGYVSTRSGKFYYERSGVINAPVEKVYPFVSNFKMGEQWSPYEQMDPNMKKTFSGTDGEVGAVMEFEGNSETGSGKLEMLKLVPNELVEMKLIMTKPLYAENLIQYRLTPEGAGTKFTWSMSGDGGFMSKLIGVLIDCEKMVGDQFNTGIANLKKVLETSN